WLLISCNRHAAWRTVRHSFSWGSASKSARRSPCSRGKSKTRGRRTTLEVALAEPIERLRPASATPLDAPAVEVCALNLWYGAFQALHDVNMNVEQHRITSLIGPSGCGKSTLLRACNRIIERLSYVRIDGQIKILGTDVYAANNEV